MLVIFCASAKLSRNRRIRVSRRGKWTIADRPDNVFLAHDGRGIATAGVNARTHDAFHHLIDGLPTRANKLVRRGGLDERAAIIAAEARGINRKRFERREARHADGCIAAGRRRWRRARE